jgi:hypothetical protein
MSALAMSATIDTLERDGTCQTATDYDQMEICLNALVDSGRIKRRHRMVERWFLRAAFVGEKLLKNNLPQLRALAAELAIRGSMTGDEINRVVKGV